jgi:hypothetical protein
MPLQKFDMWVDQIGEQNREGENYDDRSREIDNGQHYRNRDNGN